MIPFGQPRRHFAQCGSTNDVARAWAFDPEEPAPAGALVTADYQTQGRGRRGRQWQAGFGQSALMSFVYRTDGALSNAGQLSLVTALAVSEALAANGAPDPRIKWPNDILLGGQKVAGILVEAAGPLVILGIGVNVNQERFVGSKGFAHPPTSLRLVTGQPQDVEAVTEALSQALTHWEERWRQEDLLSLIEECRTRLAVGATVRRGENQAKLVGLDSDGSAQVRLPDGTFASWATVD